MLENVITHDLIQEPKETTMEYTRLGTTGLKVSRLALGCMSYGDNTTANAHRWALDEDEAQPFFREAVELGITFWDTANTYQNGTSEKVVGRSIKRYSRREDVVLATKVFGRMHDGPGGQGLSRKAILEQVDASPTRLGTDYIDPVGDGSSALALAILQHPRSHLIDSSKSPD